jgi:hypothetical protein
MAIGNVQNAVPTGVFPHALARHFVRSSSWLGRANRYADGSQQGVSLVATARELWELEFGLTGPLATVMREFYVAHGGPMIPFYYYDLVETQPRYKTDPSGASTFGRYVCRFDSPWDQQMGVGSLRIGAGLRIIQIA